MKLSSIFLYFYILAPALVLAEKPPHPVLITTDDIGYECLGANGEIDYKTSFLDSFAAGGMCFEHAHSQPICTPSRVKIMTGISNVRNYVRFDLLDPRATSFADLIKKAGNKICITGKWQWQGGFDGPNIFGLDEYCLW